MAMTVDQLPDDPDVLKAMVLARDVENARLTQIIKELQRHRFGRRAENLPEDVVPAVIEGDIASSIDADTIAARGVDVVQINTGGNCHLDAPMIRSAMGHLDLDRARVLFIENVGNLICPANYRLGADRSVVIASVAEGHDKPYKYPGIFASADIVLLNKADLIDVFEFDVASFEHGVRLVNPDVPIVHVSCRTGQGVAEWVGWLTAQLDAAPAEVQA